MSKELPQERVRRFWNTEEGVRKTGVGALGTGGEVETDYRAYFELKHLKRLISFTRNMSVLELGSGNGRWAVALAPLLGSYEGVDFSGLSVEMAERAVTEKGLTNVRFHRCSATEFLSDRQYDVLYFSGVTQYMSDDDIRKTLENLSPCIKPTTVIVDRSTVRYRHREIRDKEAACYTIYRTPQEIADIFAAHGYRLCYQKRSYHFLRGFRLLDHFYFRGPLAPLSHALAALVRATRPVSFYSLLWFSIVADIVWPAPWNKGDGSHDFILFRRDDSAPIKVRGDE